jgi:ABC-type nitrate/sulfonate/bicarbonate transport system permease component/ABC-type nitrate/sulfonate/bicarbonate transport system substrate-binding protein
MMGLPDSAHAASTVKGTHGNGFCNVAFFITHARQLAKDDGVALEFVNTPSFADQVTFLGTGQVDVSVMPYTNFMALYDAGAPVKIVAGGRVQGVYIVAQPGLDTPEKLKGKTLGTFQNDTLEVLPYDWLKKSGVSYKDITVRYMDSMGDMVAAFKSGSIDIASTIEPYGSSLLSDVKGSVLLSDGVDIYGPDYTDCVLAASTQLIEKDPKSVKALIKAMLKAQLLWEQDRETLLGELVGTYYKTSLENARIGGKAQSAKVDQQAQTDFILNPRRFRHGDGLHQKEAGQGRDRLAPSRTGDRRKSRRLRQAQIQIRLKSVSATSIKIGGEGKAANSPGFGSSLLRQTIAFVERQGPKLGWGLLSVGLFAGLWEFLWYINVADHRLLPPPHVFLGNFAEQAKNFNTAKRWEIGVDPNSGPTPFEAVIVTMASSTMRVLAGLAIASIASLCMGVVIRYYGLVGKLVLPTVTLLAPVSPVAWLPVAIFLFGIGNGPAIFMVFIALFFTMTLATITQIDSVNRNYINVARTMGASKRQIYTRVILPAILPGAAGCASPQPVRRMDGRAGRRGPPASVMASGRLFRWPATRSTLDWSISP